MIYNNKLGLHIRLKDSINQILDDALLYNVAYAQFFLTQTHRDSKYIKFSKEEQELFIQRKRELFSGIFVHSSYWINPASGKKSTQEVSRKLLKQEINLAERLEIPYIVLHSGSATWHQPELSPEENKLLGIKTLCSTLNAVLKDTTNVQILLENTAHGNLCLGSDFQDFVLIKEFLDYPEKVAFCLDFSHAFSFGYNLEKEAEFTDILEKTIGLTNLKLIHFNDSLEPMGSQKDRHAIPGEGLIGAPVLQSLIKNPAFSDIPKIIEVPLPEPEIMNITLRNISAW
ncbi:deoxyribonuclease IV [Candidatus Babeliales bacterium]|nr:deoxyribonuclease IV [Candidatus Babeliales bacterium]